MALIAEEKVHTHFEWCFLFGCCYAVVKNKSFVRETRAGMEISMLNYLWGFMIVIGISFAAFNGSMADITSAALDSAKEAVELCITMLGVMGLWTGLMRIAEVSGLIKAATKKISPFVSFMFPKIPKGHKAREHITTNIIANVFGLGWAATPAGLKAMESLAELERERGNPEYLDYNNKTLGIMTKSKMSGRKASSEMCTFLIINISSLQLIPVNIIAYRSQYGSVNPALIVAPAIVATAVSTLVGVFFAKLMDN